MSRLIGEEEPEADEVAETHAREEEAIEKPISLADQRMGAVMAALRSSGAKRVLDLGCGEGRLLRELLKEKAFHGNCRAWMFRTALWKLLHRQLHLEDMPADAEGTYSADAWIADLPGQTAAGYDAAAVVEVIEHLDPPRLAAFERVLFEFARPQDGRRDDAERRIQREV